MVSPSFFIFIFNIQRKKKKWQKATPHFGTETFHPEKSIKNYVRFSCCTVFYDDVEIFVLEFGSLSWFYLFGSFLFIISYNICFWNLKNRVWNHVFSIINQLYMVRTDGKQMKQQNRSMKIYKRVGFGITTLQ